MGKYKYRYHPDDDDADYCMGNRYQGRVVRTILTCNKHPRAIEVAFADGRHTIVHRRSFEVSETAIAFYPVGASITLKKVGYMADRRTTKWVIMRPLKYDLYDPDGIRSLMESKRTKAGETCKYQPAALRHQSASPSLAEKVKRFFKSVYTEGLHAPCVMLMVIAT